MNAATALIRVAIRAYRLLISPVTAPACRFEPSCSSYALEAVDRHGAAKGSWLALKRLGRCHPWGGSGYDPVPDPDPMAPRGSASGDVAMHRDATADG
jgi:putative membrane protein insertion efficiency factor